MKDTRQVSIYQPGHALPISSTADVALNAGQDQLLFQISPEEQRHGADKSEELSSIHLRERSNLSNVPLNFLAGQLKPDAKEPEFARQDEGRGKRSAKFLKNILSRKRVQDKLSETELPGSQHPEQQPKAFHSILDGSRLRFDQFSQAGKTINDELEQKFLQLGGTLADKRTRQQADPQARPSEFASRADSLTENILTPQNKHLLSNKDLNVQANGLQDISQTQHNIELTNPPESAQRMLCRICLDGDETDSQLISPCRCLGSCKMVHESCLKEWILRKQKVFMQKDYVFSAEKCVCELCKFSYRMEVKKRRIADYAYNWRHSRPYFFLASVALLFLLVHTYFILDYGINYRSKYAQLGTSGARILLSLNLFLFSCFLVIFLRSLHKITANTFITEWKIYHSEHALLSQRHRNNQVLPLNHQTRQGPTLSI